MIRNNRDRTGKRNKKVRKLAMDESKIDLVIEKYEGKAGSLIQILLDIQKETGWLSNEVLEKVSEKLGVPLSKVLHSATFYKAFRTIPEGRHEIHVCNGTSCHNRGSSRVLGTVQDIIGIRPGESTPDSRFSLEAVTCMGCCSSGPVMAVDGKYHGEVDPDGAEEVLKNCD